MQEGKRKGIKWPKRKGIKWPILILAVILCAAVIAVSLYIILRSGSNQSTDQVTSKLYWNADRLDYLKDSDLSSRKAEADGTYKIRFAVDGELVEYSTRDRQLMNQIDHKDLMGLVFDEEGYIIGYLEPEDITAGEVARMAYVMSVDGNKFVANTSGTADGLNIELEITDKTNIYDVTGVEPVGQKTTLQVNDRIRGFVDKEGNITNLFVLEREGVVVYDGERMEKYCAHCDVRVNWILWAENDSLPTETGHWCLTKNVGCDDTNYIQKSSQVVLDLNGKTVTGKANTRVYWLESTRDPYLAILDQSKEQTGTIIANGEMDQGCVILIRAGSVELYSGTLDASMAVTRLCGGAIRVEPGTRLTMYGGTIIGGHAKANMKADRSGVQGGYGGSVQVCGNAVFTMYDGVIRDGKATSMVDGSGWDQGGIGGNVHVQANGKFIMEGGQILNGSASINGGNVYLESGSADNMGADMELNGGIISGGISKASNLPGGNIYVGWKSTLTMTGGSIEDGRSMNTGGNMVLYGTLNMSGGKIINGMCLTGDSVDTAVHSPGVASQNIFLVNGYMDMSGGYINGGVDMVSTGLDANGIDWSSVIKLSGNAQIKDGQGGNVFLDNGEVLRLGNLTDGAYISVTGEGYITDKTTAANAAFIHSDDDSSKIYYRDEKVYLGRLSCVCGQDEHIGGCTGELLEWTPWRNTEDLPDSTGNYYLVSDVNMATIRYAVEGSTIRLDLNGKTVTSSQDRIYNLRSEGATGINLIITDLSVKKTGTMKVAHDRAGEQGTIFWFANGNTVDIYGGTFDASAVSSPGHVGIAVSFYGEGTRFNMYGGTIIGGYATTAEDGTAGVGGSIWIGDGSVMNMTGGMVLGGKADGNGGNIYVSHNAKLNVSGGEIKDGDAFAGGNIFTYGDVTISGGVISGGNCMDNGGSIHLTPAGTLTISGGTIQGGYARDSGGNIAVFGTLRICGGEIKDGIGGVNADSGNIFINQGEGRSFTMTGGKVAGLIRVHASQSLNVSGAPVISGGETNLCLYNGTILSLGDMQEGADIHITAASGPFAQKATDADITFFTSDAGLTIDLCDTDKLMLRVSFTVMSNNILAATIHENDNVPQEVYEIPLERFKLLYAAYEYYMPDVVAFQEVDWLWHDDLLDNLTGNAESLGVKPFTALGYAAVAANEKWPAMNNNPLYYNTATLNVIAEGWLPYYPEDAQTDTPWSFTWGVFESKLTGERFAVSSTHILSSGWFGDSVDSEPLRKQEIADLVAFMKNIEEEYGCPVILMGDFNTDPSADAYAAFELGDKLLSARDVATVVEGGNYRTHNVLNNEPAQTDPANIGVIDHIMISPTGIIAEKYQTLVEEFAEGIFTYSYSDHVPVRMVFRLTGQSHTHTYGLWTQEEDNYNAHVRHCECGMAQRQIHSWSLADGKTLCDDCGQELPETAGKIGCYCAGVELEGHTCEELYWVPWNSTDSLPYSSGNYYLTCDVQTGTTYYVNSNSTIRLDLNGHTVTSTATKVYNLRSSIGVEVVITDNSTEKKGMIKNVREGVGEQGMIFWIAGGNKVELYAGTLDASAISSPNHAGVAVSMYGEGTAFHMYGGTILGGHATGDSGKGGSIWLGDYASFLMTGGTISGGKADSAGGNVNMDSNTTFTMTGGIIENGQALGNGGNVYMHWDNTTFTMTGGTITGGIAGGMNDDGSYNYACGGNVHTQGIFYMNGGVIENGSIAPGGSMGGNVSTYGSTSRFYMTDGIIRGGTCSMWGGDNVRIGSNSTFHMTGGTIDGTGAKMSSVFFESATSMLVLDGNAKIFGATNNVVMNSADNKFYLGDALVTSGADAAQIWVSATAGRILADANVTADCANVFHVDGEATNGLYVDVPDGYGILMVQSTTNPVVFWKSTDVISFTANADGFTVSWPAADNALSYLVKIGDDPEIPVSGTSYVATGFARRSYGYSVTITAVGAGGNSLMKLTGVCNAAYDPDAMGIDTQLILSGNQGGDITNKYALYRIPGLVVTKDNTLIAYYEARISNSDTSPMDILAFRSTDGGETWSDPIVLAAGADDGVVMNNPVIIVGNDSAKTLHFIYCVNYGICSNCNDSATAACESHSGAGVYYRKSTDDGLTWSTPVNITDSTNPAMHYVVATGPNTGICKDDGTLIVPIWFVKKENGQPDPLSHWPSDVATIYSTDGGQTWQMGEVLTANAQIESKTEPTLTLLSDGRVMMNIRCSGGWRGVAVSSNGYSGWSTIEYDTDLIDPFCHAGIVAYYDGVNPYSILFSNCESDFGNDYLNLRSNLVLKGSVNDGADWTYSKVIEPGDAGYSSIAVDHNGTIYVLYEVRAGEQIKLAKLNYEYLKVEEKGCYCAGNGTDDHVCDDTIEWTPWSDPSGLPDTSGNYYLTTDVTITYRHYLQGNIRLDLNGHTVTAHQTATIFDVQHFTGVSLTITDRSAQKNGSFVITGTFENEMARFADIRNGNSVHMYAGIIDASGLTTSTEYGATISIVTSGTFNLYGGTIKGANVIGNGGAVWMQGQTYFNMHGGTITGGRATGQGGNVFVGSGAEFTLNDGTISYGIAHNTAEISNNWRKTGGNVELIGTFYMNGGVIEYGSLGAGGSMGGNVSLNNSSARFYMTDGIIRGGRCTVWGGANVRITAGSVFEMTGGLIDGTDTNISSVFLEGNGSRLVVGGSARILGGATNIKFNHESNVIELRSDLITSGENAAQIFVSGDSGRVIAQNAVAEQVAVFKSDNISLEVYFDESSRELKMRSVS